MTGTLGVVLGIGLLIILALIVLGAAGWVVFLIGATNFSNRPADTAKLRYVMLAGLAETAAYLIVLYMLVKFVKWSWNA